MIPPYSGPLLFEIGPVSVALFGALVATGVMVGHEVAVRLAEKRGVPGSVIRNAAACAVLAGFFGAHLFDVVFYRPEKFSRDGFLVFLKVWDGISSFGGFFGAIAGVATYFARRGKSWWTEADCLMQGLVVGWLFGRLGCTLTSDHPGRLSDFALAFAYSDGARHNLGFYEFAYTALVLLPAMLWLGARERRGGYRPGVYVAAMAALYAPARFAMDFLRATDIAKADPRYLGLTAGQYFALMVVAGAIFMLGRLRRARPSG